MADREKVMNGLECCSIGLYCPDEGYPYEKDKEEKQENCIALLARDALRDALELLKAQEPRVMTLEEVKRLLPGADVWIEYHDLTGWRISAITVREIFDNGLLGELQSLRYSFDRYGRYNGDWLAWRCWTSRPTDEQRKAVKWE